MFDRSSQASVSNWWWSVDKVTLFTIIVLIIFGGVCLSSASFAVAKRIDVSPNFFIRKQLPYIFLAFSVLIGSSFMSHGFIKSISPIFYLLMIIVTIWTAFFGIEIKGSRRWISIFGFSMQPSEFFKISFVLLNAKLLDLLVDIDSPREKLILYFASFSLCIVSMLVLAMQPDIGMACLIFCAWVAQFFIADVQILFLLVPALFFLVSGGLVYLIFDHVKYRINNFIFGISNQDELYQIKKSLETFKNGGWFGVGPWQGKLKFSLPDSHTDFIFSVISEEFGLIIAALLILVYAFVVFRAILMVYKKHDLFKISVVFGLSIMFMVQVMINIGVNIRILPAKGMTLPFISYGGSSIISSAVLIGIILSINRKEYNNQEINFLYDR
jgi:cell division protein FtsW